MSLLVKYEKAVGCNKIKLLMKIRKIIGDELSYKLLKE